MLHFDISHLSYENATLELAKVLENKDKIACHIDFGVDHSQSKIIRDFVGSIFDAHNITHPWRGRFILITDELVNNAIEHGSQEGDIDSCVIEAGKRTNGEFFITLEVHDTGNGKDAKDATHMDQIKEKTLCERDENGIYMEKRGRGLFHITEKLVDKLSFSQSPKGGLAVKIEKRIAENK